jgi:hypothetical protein
MTVVLHPLHKFVHLLYFITCGLQCHNLHTKFHEYLAQKLNGGQTGTIREHSNLVSQLSLTKERK